MTSIFIKNICCFRFQRSQVGTKNRERRKNNLKALVLLGFLKNLPFPVPDLSFRPQPLFYKAFPVPNIYYVYIGMFFPRTHTYIQNVKTDAVGIHNLILEASA